MDESDNQTRERDQRDNFKNEGAVEQRQSLCSGGERQRKPLRYSRHAAQLAGFGASAAIASAALIPA
jgi:hypothetical protein